MIRNATRLAVLAVLAGLVGLAAMSCVSPRSDRDLRRAIRGVAGDARAIHAGGEGDWGERFAAYHALQVEGVVRGLLVRRVVSFAGHGSASVARVRAGLRPGPDALPAWFRDEGCEDLDLGLLWPPGAADGDGRPAGIEVFGFPENIDRYEALVRRRLEAAASPE